MTAALRVTWTLEGPGWAGCSVEDHRGRVDLVASDITEAPEDLLNAVARVVAGATESRAQFEAEPTAYRWIFYREGEDVWLPNLGLRAGSHHDNKGTESWSCQLSVAAPSSNGSVAVWLPRWNATSDG